MAYFPDLRKPQQGGQQPFQPPTDPAMFTNAGAFGAPATAKSPWGGEGGLIAAPDSGAFPPIGGIPPKDGPYTGPPQTTAPVGIPGQPNDPKNGGYSGPPATTNGLTLQTGGAPPPMDAGAFGMTPQGNGSGYAGPAAMTNGGGGGGGGIRPVDAMTNVGGDLADYGKGQPPPLANPDAMNNGGPEVFDGNTNAPQAVPDAGAVNPNPAAMNSGWAPGPAAGHDVTLLGFDANKLADPNSGSADGSKYTPAAKAFYQGLKQDVGLSRSGLGNMVSYLQGNGFANAKAVGDDKIDFGDGNGPVDVVRSDGQIVFQNTTGNPNWEAQHGGAPAAAPGGDLAQPPSWGGPGAGGPGSGGGGGGGGVNPAAALQGLPDYVAQAIDMPTDYNPQAIAGPDAWQAQQIAANQVTGPQALTAAQIAAADPFRATTEADLLADPGYAVRLKNSLAALQQSAAAKGILRTGGTLQDLSAKAGEQTSAEFANADARRRSDYQTQLSDRLAVGQANNASNAQAYGLTNQYQQGAQVANQGANLQAAQANAANSLASWQAYQGMRQNTSQFNAARTDTAAQQNFANRFNVQNANNSNSLAGYQANTNARLGYGNLANQQAQTANAFSLGQGQLALGNRTADQSYDLGLRGNALGYYNADTSRQSMQGQQSLGWANYGLNADQQQFGQGYSLAQLGLQASGQYGNYAEQYGAQSGNNATQYGNAGAAGTVGGANAWAAGASGAAGSASQAYAQWLASQRH